MKIKKSIFSILLSIILLLATSLPCFAYLAVVCNPLCKRSSDWNDGGE